MLSFLTLASGPLAFRVHLPASAFPGKEKVSAVVYLSRKGGEPRFGPDWFDPQPCYAARFSAKAGDVLTVEDADAVGYPGHLSDLAPGEYTVQAVVDRNLGGRTIAESDGNFYSKPVKMSLDAKSSGPIDLNLTEVARNAMPASTERVKYVAIPSPLLSAWYKRPTTLKATVVLPEGYDGKRAFPTLYIAEGFGSPPYVDPRLASRVERIADRGGKPFVNVILDANCPGGHSVFADSANNGPWGKALTTEMIPALERQFRLEAKPSARLLRGHSSGGWTSLWLQVAYPDFFGGTWSTSPDPVDFHDFQRIDLYAPGANMFTDPSGAPRPLARTGDKPIVFYKAFSDMERPIRGEQLGSFEWAFSPRGADGAPKPLWNRDTGAVDPTVAATWRKYDIADKLRREWPTLAPKLKGKLHVFCGNADTFYLDGAVRLLQKEMKNLGSDAEVEMVPGDHGSMMTPALRAKIDAEMAATQK